MKSDDDFSASNRKKATEKTASYARNKNMTKTFNLIVSSIPSDLTRMQIE